MQKHGVLKFVKLSHVLCNCSLVSNTAGYAFYIYGAHQGLINNDGHTILAQKYAYNINTSHVDTHFSRVMFFQRRY